MINEHIQRPWSENVKEALEKFRLGDLIKRPPFFYGHGGAIRLWHIDSEDQAENANEKDGDGQVAGPPEGDEASLSAVEELHPDDGPSYGIVTTQTCDLDEQGDPMQPWFQVSPVYELTGTEQQRDKLAAKQFIFELNGTALPEGQWVADLRIELPMEKSILAGRDPIRGFATEADAEAFARELGRRRARAALANELVNDVIALLRARRGKRKGMWMTHVFRLMLEIEGTRLAPAAVRLT